MKTEELQKKVIREVALYQKKAEKHYKRKFPKIKTLFTLRGVVGGVAKIKDNSVNFNMILLMENEDEYWFEVIPHEVAHIINHKVNKGVRAHGSEWKYIMRNVFGVEPETTHNMDTTRSEVWKMRRFQYKCLDCGKKNILTSIRHNRQKNGTQEYYCDCWGTLKYVRAIKK